ncbi:DUF2905 domain-containing protein [Pontibacillus halophilus]|uniref:DUF2905 domain-containing protein n=1 Tax=Pontibacillus halophilus TaxID=516704 RepID=UPI002EDB6FA8
MLGVLFLLIGGITALLGKLPGDLTFKKGNVTFYFPIMTSIVVSVILSLLFYLFNKFR